MTSETLSVRAAELLMHSWGVCIIEREGEPVRLTQLPTFLEEMCVSYMEPYEVKTVQIEADDVAAIKAEIETSMLDRMADWPTVDKYRDALRPHPRL